MGSPASSKPITPLNIMAAIRIARLYLLSIEPHTDLGYIGRAKEMPQIFGDGDTPTKCIEKTYERLTFAVANMLQEEMDIPQSIDYSSTKKYPDRCIGCGEYAVIPFTKHQNVNTTHNEVKIELSVPDMPVFKCEKCGDISYDSSLYQQALNRAKDRFDTVANSILNQFTTDKEMQDALAESVNQLNNNDIVVAEGERP